MKVPKPKPSYLKAKNRLPLELGALRYTQFISPMIKAIQELSAKVTALESAN